jgi:hypothetical protein
MFSKTLKLGENSGDTQMVIHHFGIKADTKKTALGHVAGGKAFVHQLPKPSMGANVMLMVIPGGRHQHIDIQQIHASFLG